MYLLYSLARLLFITSAGLVRYAAARIFTPSAQLSDLQGRVLKRVMIDLGPLYIKIGQIAATRSDFFSEGIVKYLSELQDDVPPMTDRQLRSVLRNAYRMPADRVFTEIFPMFRRTPVASASIAQVHRARLADGRETAVKIVKYHVEKKLKTNLLILGSLIRLFHRFIPVLQGQNLPRRFQEMSDLLIDQADMEMERKRQKTIAHNFRGHPYVIVPEVFEEYCRSDILTMSFAEGIRGQEPHRVHLDRKTLARRAQDGIYTMLFLHGTCHGDPHPGNFFYTPEGKLILLDYGITIELTEDEKWGITSFIYACIRGEWNLAVERFTHHFVIGTKRVLAECETYRNKVLPVLHKHFNLVSGQWSIIRFLQDMNHVLADYNAHYSYNFQKVVLVFLSCEGISTMIDPTIHIWENARKFADRYSPYMNEEVKARFDEYFGRTIPKSLEQKRRAAEALVAPTHLDRYVLPSAYPLFIERAEGSTLIDIDGNEYVDLSCGYGPHILGYGHRVFKEALEEAAGYGSINAMAHMPEIELAELIVEAVPSAEKVIFSNSGTESIIQALRICRGYRKRDMVAKFEGHYHGFSDQGMVSSWFRFRGTKTTPLPIAGCLGTHSKVVENTLVLQYGRDYSLDLLRKRADRLAAVIVEPMPSATATYDISFLTDLRSVCTELDIPLVFDEVVSGFRVDYAGVQGITGVTPDLTCLGKIIGGGLPCGAVAGRSDLVEVAKTSLDPFKDYEQKVFVGGTMSGNSPVCTTGKAMLNYLRSHREIYEKLRADTISLADDMRETARKMQVPFVMKAGHSIFSMAFSYAPSEYFREKSAGSNIKANIALSYYMRKNGVYVPELHTMFLSAAHSDEDLSRVRRAFESALTEMVADGFFVL